VEDAGFRKRTTTRGVDGLRSMAVRYVPGLVDAEVSSAWAGLRPGSPDGLPVIGRLPGRENAYVATGHFRNGILLAPVTGKLRQNWFWGRLDGRLAPFAGAFEHDDDDDRRKKCSPGVRAQLRATAT
jgi:glycine oxidase